MKARPRGRAALVALAVLAGALAVSPAAAREDSGVRIPSGYRVIGRTRLATGAVHLSLQNKRWPQRIHIARIARGAPVNVRAQVARDRVAGPGTTETTSSMCRRYGCLAAINGDFFARTGIPVGGLITGGEVVRSPKRTRPQLIVTASKGLAIRTMKAGARITATYPATLPASPSPEIDPGLPGAGPPAVEPERRTVEAAGINVVRPRDGIVLYTPRYGARTGTNPYGVELIFRTVSPEGPLRAGKPAEVLLRSMRYQRGNTAIPADGFVLSGHGDGARVLRDLWRDAEEARALPEMTAEVATSYAAYQSIAGNPVLVDNGKAVRRPRGPAARSKAPRTMAGWNRDGDLLLVTVDGRQRGRASGFTLAQAAAFMRAIGAVEAINLDGGGSTTFVAKGRVLNKPSDREVIRDGRRRLVRYGSPGDRVLRYRERRVATALLILPA